MEAIPPTPAKPPGTSSSPGGCAKILPQETLWSFQIKPTWSPSPHKIPTDPVRCGTTSTRLPAASGFSRRLPIAALQPHCPCPLDARLSCVLVVTFASKVLPLSPRNPAMKNTRHNTTQEHKVGGSLLSVASPHALKHEFPLWPPHASSPTGSGYTSACSSFCLSSSVQMLISPGVTDARIQLHSVIGTRGP